MPLSSALKVMAAIAATPTANTKYFNLVLSKRRAYTVSPG